MEREHVRSAEPNVRYGENRKQMKKKSGFERNKIPSIMNDLKKEYVRGVEKRKAMPGRKRCGICLKKDADARRVKNADKINIREYREKNHLCYFCGKPIDLPTGKTCKDCVEKFKKLAKGRRNKNDYWKRQNRLIFGGKAVD